jgi:hypothetical protein
MTYALLQQSMDPPPVDALRRAFRNSRSLSAADAIFVADDAFGILARDIPEDEAQSLAATLSGEGIETDLVAENQLPRLPDARFFLSLGVEEGTLNVFDAVECIERIPWAALRLIAVGFDQRDVRLELIIGDALLRYFSTMNRMHVPATSEVSGRTAQERLISLVRRMHQLAPQAWLNRGAQSLLGEISPERVAELAAYPRPSAFVEEMTWLLWRARQSDLTEDAAS